MVAVVNLTNAEIVYVRRVRMYQNERSECPYASEANLCALKLGGYALKQTHHTRRRACTRLRVQEY